MKKKTLAQESKDLNATIILEVKHAGNRLEKALDLLGKLDNPTVNSAYAELISAQDAIFRIIGSN